MSHMDGALKKAKRNIIIDGGKQAKTRRMVFEFQSLNLQKNNLKMLRTLSRKSGTVIRGR